MTEQEWLECTDPERLLNHLDGKTHRCGLGCVLNGEIPFSNAAARKLGLFACACCRRIPCGYLHDGDQSALAILELFFDGKATHPELNAVKTKIGLNPITSAAKFLTVYSAAAY